MDVTLLVTKTDFATANLESELKNLGVEFNVQYIENNPELVSAFQIRHSPNILVNGNLIFRTQPTPEQLKAYFLP